MNFSSPDGYIALKQCILIKTGRVSDRKVGYPFYPYIAPIQLVAPRAVRMAVAMDATI